MKKNAYRRMKPLREGKSTFSVRLAVCTCLALALLALRAFGPADFFDVLLYRLDEGPTLSEIIEALGQTPVSVEALEKLWHDGVVEVLRLPL
ncbi:MAG: hypothetical protein IIZ49_06880 [Oscillospiraceae bacterium]|nr:hypothetical protein [Oscillospiraceae bacterium]MBQ3878713.1 hypothetical protein [Oscillospiraceae bacterium]